VLPAHAHDLHVAKSGGLQHCLALQYGRKWADALSECTLTLYISEAAAAPLQTVAGL